MHVNGKLLLNSAKDILKSYQQRDSKASVKLNPDLGQDVSKINSTDSTKGNSIKVRMLELQSRLKAIQNDYTREQVRQDYLLNRSDELNGNLEYKNGQLFPEYNSGRDIESLKNMVAKKLAELLRGLKSVQVEIENLYAINFQRLSTDNIAHAEQLNRLDGIDFDNSSLTLKNIDPERVSKLTELK